MKVWQWACALAFFARPMTRLDEQSSGIVSNKLSDNRGVLVVHARAFKPCL
jgi:hypothetical protein